MALYFYREPYVITISNINGQSVLNLKNYSFFINKTILQPVSDYKFINNRDSELGWYSCQVQLVAQAIIIWLQ